MSGIVNALIGSYPTPVTGSFESIATNTLSSSSASITFSSIPNTYRHLQIRSIGKDTFTTTNTNGGWQLRFNGDNASNYAWHGLYANGANATASGQDNIDSISIARATWTSNSSGTDIYGATILDIHDYASTTKNKTVRCFAGGDANTGTTASGLAIQSGLWMSTAAITSITITASWISFAAGSTFALYGIKGA